MLPPDDRGAAGEEKFYARCCPCSPRPRRPLVASSFANLLEEHVLTAEATERLTPSRNETTFATARTPLNGI
jgi:hypothetical protein